jgi:hypothetical protein
MKHSYLFFILAESDELCLKEREEFYVDVRKSEQIRGGRKTSACDSSVRSDSEALLTIKKTLRRSLQGIVRRPQQVQRGSMSFRWARPKQQHTQNIKRP